MNYEKIELTSAVITMNMDSSTVYARGVPDSAGVEKGTPVFKDGETPYESKIMRYNFKSKKGFINNIVTQQGEGYVTSEESKKVLMMNFICVTDDILRLIITNILTSI